MISKTINEGLKFAFSFKLIIPYLILYLVSFYFLIGFFYNIVNIITSKMGGFGVLLSLGIYLPIFIIIGLAYLWINGAIIDQARYYPKRKPLIKSFEYSTSRYLTMLCAMVLYLVISSAISFPPYIGPVLSFILSLMLFYLYSIIIVDKKGCIDSFKKSFNVFFKYPLETFVTWFLVAILSFIMVVAFALPIIFFFLGDIINTWTNATSSLTNVNGPQPFFNSLIPVIMSRFSSPFFILCLFILCLGLSMNSVFQIGTRTRLYLNTKKKEI